MMTNQNLIICCEILAKVIISKKMATEDIKVKDISVRHAIVALLLEGKEEPTAQNSNNTS